MRIFRIGLLSAAALGAVLPAAGAAQTVANAQPQPTDGADDGDIVITARRRSESLYEVPVAVTALSGDALEARGANDTSDLFGSTPGLYLSQSGQRRNDEQFYLTIRGVGSSPVVEPSVGLFVDGVYMPSLGWTSDFLDVERVEILRGPQGALFGRNTEAGAVSITSRRPSDTLRGRISVEAAEFDTYRAAGTLSGPISTNLAAGLAAFVSTTDGYTYNVTRDEAQDNRTRFGVRGSLRAQLGDRVEVFATADYLKSTGRFVAYGDAIANQAVTIVDPQAPVAQRGTFLRNHVLAGSRYTSYGNDENRTETRSYGGALTAAVDFGGVILTSITGYRRAEADDIYDNDGIATANSTNQAATVQRIASQELRLTSDDDGRLEWIAGAYGFTERLRQDRLSRFVQGVLAGPIVGSGDAFGFTSDNARISRDGFALFAQATYHLTPALELAVGGRYSYEDVRQDPNLRVRVQIGPTVVDVANTTSQRRAFDGFSPSASLSYRFARDLLGYASVATGYKGGGFTKEVPNTPLQNAAIENETSINYELGMRGRLFGRAVSFSAAFFYTQLRDQQLSTRIELSPGSGIYIPSTQNVGRGHSQGVELEVLLQPVRALRIAGSLSYTDTQFDDYVAAPATPTLPEYNRAGQAFPEVPRWLASASIEYDIALGGVTLTPRLGWRHVGSTYVGQGNASIPFIPVASYDILDAQVAVDFGRWTATLYATNLTDNYYFVNQFQLQGALSAPGNQTYAQPGAPRQIGLRLGYAF